MFDFHFVGFCSDFPTVLEFFYIFSQCPCILYVGFFVVKIFSFTWFGKMRIYVLFGEDICSRMFYVDWEKEKLLLEVDL